MRSARLLAVAFAMCPIAAANAEVREVVLRVRLGDTLIGTASARGQMNGEPIVIAAGKYELTFRIDPTLIEQSRRRYLSRTELRIPEESGRVVRHAPLLIVEPGRWTRITLPVWEGIDPTAEMMIR